MVCLRNICINTLHKGDEDDDDDDDDNNNNNNFKTFKANRGTNTRREYFKAKLLFLCCSPLHTP